MKLAQFRRALAEAGAGGSHTRAEWMQVLVDQGFMCFWCGKNLRDKRGILRATKDHLLPLARGGNHNIGNIAAACRACNSSKGDRTAEEFRAHLKAKGQRIATICTVPTIREDFVFAKSIPACVRQFTDQITERKFPARPDHYWKERRAFLRWQIESLKKGEAACLVFKGMEVTK